MCVLVYLEHNFILLTMLPFLFCRLVFSFSFLPLLLSLFFCVFL